MRPSGTEPKIKFYFMIRENSSDLSSNKKIAHLREQELHHLITSLCEKA